MQSVAPRPRISHGLQGRPSREQRSFLARHGSQFFGLRFSPVRQEDELMVEKVIISASTDVTDIAMIPIILWRATVPLTTEEEK